MSDHRAHLRLSTASLLEIVALSTAYQAAVVRGAPEAELTDARTRIHDVVDAYLDQMSAAAVATRTLLGD